MLPVVEDPVYEAEDIDLHRFVALKFCHKTLSRRTITP